MFGNGMEDMELCREGVEYLLDHPIGELKEVQTEWRFLSLRERPFCPCHYEFGAI